MYNLDSTIFDDVLAISKTDSQLVNTGPKKHREDANIAAAPRPHRRIIPKSLSSSDSTDTSSVSTNQSVKEILIAPDNHELIVIMAPTITDNTVSHHRGKERAPTDDAPPISRPSGYQTRDIEYTVTHGTKSAIPVDWTDQKRPLPDYTDDGEIHNGEKRMPDPGISTEPKAGYKETPEEEVVMIEPMLPSSVSLQRFVSNKDNSGSSSSDDSPASVRSSSQDSRTFLVAENSPVVESKRAQRIQNPALVSPEESLVVHGGVVKSTSIPSPIISIQEPERKLFEEVELPVLISPEMERRLEQQFVDSEIVEETGITNMEVLSSPLPPSPPEPGEGVSGVGLGGL